MGQGTYTSISMILAEELDADWSRVRVEHAPADEKLYANPILTIQATGNSNSIRAFWKPLRTGRRRRARLPRRGRGAQLGRRVRRVPDGERQSHPRPHRPHTRLRRVGQPRRHGHAAEGPATQGRQHVPADRPPAEAPGHAGQDERQGQVRHRCPAAGVEIRDARREPGARRHRRSRRR